jgi:oligogalacturonide lyase
MARFSSTTRFGSLALAGLALLLLPLGAIAQSAASTNLPRTWVDKDTGHRVVRLTDEPSSSGFYFNVNAYTPDEKTMVYTAPDGIHGLDLATRKTWLIVPNPAHDATDPAARRNAVHTIVVGHKTNSVFFSQNDPATKRDAIYKADVYTKAVTKLAELPADAPGVATVNADETLAAGTMNDGPAVAPEYGANAVSPTGTPRVGGAAAGAPQQQHGALSGNLVQPMNKGEMMERRLASRQPLILYTISLRPEDSGKIKVLLHSTDWVNHLLFSPADPTLLMYCHEGPWQKVDRIWMIHTDGTHNTLIHHRRIAMEIAGHEFWGLDGQTIWYDWQPIKGQDFYLAGYNLGTGERTAYHMDRNDWSIHFNLTKDLSLFCGDGGDPGQVAKAPDGEWIELFHPHKIDTAGAINSPDFFQPGYFTAEHLVNMAWHNYRLEPNVRFSPDASMVIFTSNMFGPSYVFGVEVSKAENPPAADVVSTPELAAKYNPIKPTPTGAPRPAAAHETNPSNVRSSADFIPPIHWRG